MDDVYLYVKDGVATPELSLGIRDSLPRFLDQGYRVHLLPPTELAPDNSDCLIIGDWKTLGGREEALKSRGCRVALYFMESLPSLDYKGNLYRGDGHWSELAWKEFKSKIHLYDYLVFYDGGHENYVLENHPEIKGKTCTYFLGVHDSYRIKTSHESKYDLLHFGWCPFGNRRESILKQLSRGLSIHPTWSSTDEERTRVFNSSKHILSLSFYAQPRFSWIRFIFAVCNKMMLFTEASYCEPVYTQAQGGVGEIVPNKHFIELPYLNTPYGRDVGEVREVISKWLDKPKELQSMVDENYAYFHKEYSLPDRLIKLFGEVFYA